MVGGWRLGSTFRGSGLGFPVSGSSRRTLGPGGISSHRKCFGSHSARSQLPHKSSNSSSTITNIKNNLTDLCGNRLLQNDFEKTLREIELRWLVPYLGFRG